MIDRLRVALAQINTTVGDVAGNTERVSRRAREAREQGADIVAFPELALTGYPPEDLLLKPSFIEDNLCCLRQLAAESDAMTLVVGFAHATEDIYNAAAVLQGGEIRGVYHKIFLPNYGVFDENRYFQAGGDAQVYELGGAGVGITICEDVWYATGPAGAEAIAGAELILNISASPYRRGVTQHRERMLATRAQDHSVYVAYVNLVGGQDELIFDGSSAIFDAAGALVARAPAFREALLVTDIDVGAVFRQRLHDPRGRKLAAQERSWYPVESLPLGAPPHSDDRPPIEPQVWPVPPPTAEVYEALTLAIRDYVSKSAYTDTVAIGLSGGIDSSLVAALATDALGSERVVGVSMPSRYSSEGSRTDAHALAENLGIRLLVLPIEGPYAAFLEALAEPFAGTEFGLAEENLQARIRGVMLMALSNKFGWLVLTAGNKSETSTGYATLYGADTTGAFAPLRDVPKSRVYELARLRNERGAAIPTSVIEKPPSAELRPDQRDEDSLPPYSVLDPILELYVEHDHSPEEIVRAGHDAETVARVIGLVDHAEYKRRQSPPGPKVSRRAFGRDRRLPIINGYRE